MKTALPELDLLALRRRRDWRRLADPAAPAPELPPDEPPALGYPRHHPLLRALSPLALAFLLFLFQLPSCSAGSTPRGNPPAASAP